jgi:hypothetical protein
MGKQLHDKLRNQRKQGESRKSLEKTESFPEYVIHAAQIVSWNVRF